MYAKAAAAKEILQRLQLPTTQSHNNYFVNKN